MTNQTDHYNADLSSGIAAFDTKNFAVAYQLLSPLVAKGEVEALFRVGMMQANGLGMVANQSLGLENLKLAAEAGHSIAHHMAGVAYMEGEGVEKDIDQAIIWFTKAASFGLLGAMYVLASLYEEGTQIKQDLEKSKYWYDQAEKIA